ncbi:MAG: MauE/DoxX family redox-associated membrane protein [Ktedonobacterales bacterium]
MAIVLLGARLLLALVFLAAGTAKLADWRGSQKAITAFGLPAALAPTLGFLLPLAELAVAVALVPRPTAWWGALGALALLLLFSAGISYNLAQGRRPDCHCFGQLHSQPIGWPTLVRNGLLAVPALLILGLGRSDPGLSTVAWLGSLSVAEFVGLALALVACAGLAAEGWLLFHLLRQNGRLLIRLDTLEGRWASGGNGTVPAPVPGGGLPIGAGAPPFRLAGLYGETLTLEALRAPGTPVVLAFVDPGCGPCTALLPDLSRWQRDYMGTLTLALISRGSVEANRAKIAEHGFPSVLLQQDREVAQAYRAYGTPSAVVVRPDGTIGSALAQGADQIRLLVATTMGLPAVGTLARAVPATMLNGHDHGNGHGGTPARAARAVVGPQVGEAAPPLVLPDLEGNLVSLADFRGEPTAVLFWNPACGFCQKMLEDLKAWEATAPEGAPHLLVVSTGTSEGNQALGLRAPVVLDQGFRSGQTFGASGTPSAVLVDAEGKIASAVAVGAPGVLALVAPAAGTATPPIP